MTGMPENKTPAVFYRGGTSKAVFFHTSDLPEDPAERDQLLLNVLGSPDPYGRQLNGLGGGISSLSKAMWVERSKRNDADIDYTFAQIAIGEAVVDYSANCGNMSSAVGQFAIEEGIFPVPDGDAVIRMYNTNTDICVHSHFRVEGGCAVTQGNLEIPGVTGTGAQVRLEFMDPSRITGRGLLPTGAVQETIEVPRFGKVSVSIVDAAALGVFVSAEELGMKASEAPLEIEAKKDVMAALDIIRREAALRAGMCERAEDVPVSAPRVALVASPTEFTSLDGRVHRPEDYQLAVRMESLRTIHRALPVTGAMCVAAAAMIEGSVPNKLANRAGTDDAIQLGNPSGVTVMEASVSLQNGHWQAASTSVLRTIRRLMDGHVYHP
jgi:2-methylaconitate cis-trans-isomerase PrpF